MVAPIAILIGLGLDDGMHALVNVILLSLTTGIYLYYACSEVMVKELQDKGGVLMKLMAIVLGIIIILGLVFIESGHDHGSAANVAAKCAFI